MDTVRGMELFARVVEEESFSAAARSLKIAPSSVSRLVGELEDALGVRLLNRSTRRLSVTEAGQVYYERARRILREIEEAHQTVSGLDGEPRGLLRLSVPYTFARLHIVPALPAFTVRYPEVEIELSLSDQMTDLVAEGIDMAIRIGELKSSSLIARKLVSSAIMICGSPEYLAKAGIPESPEQLAGHNCMVRTARPKSDLWRFTGPGGPSEVRVSGALKSNDGEALHTAVMEGMGIGRFPVWVCGADLVSGKLQRVLPGYIAEPSNHSIQAVYPATRHLSPKVRAFIDFLVERCRAQSFWALGRESLQDSEGSAPGLFAGEESGGRPGQHHTRRA